MSSRVPNTSPVTGQPVAEHYIHASGKHFRDNAGRTLLLRGVNLCTKQPRGRSSFDPPHLVWHVAENGGESFKDTPFRLDDDSVDEHLARLRAWGFNCIRYLFTWEALEHEGPGKYDYEYMDYVIQVLRKVKSYGFRVFMDPHQDLFSRFTGGCGAPFWVLPACGINRRNITATQAAFLQFEWPDAEHADPQNFPPMLWATNYSRLAASTLSSLFFAGRDLAPLCVIDGQNIQDWLQGHFIAACTQLAQRVHDAGDLEDCCVIGWDSMNEPNPTYVGLPIWDRIPQSWPLKMGPMPTPLQSMQLGMGRVQKVEHWSFGALGPKRLKDIEIDPQGAKLWLTPEADQVQGGNKWGWERSSSWPLGVCPWAAHGAWDVDTGKVKDQSFFGRSRLPDAKPGQTIDFIEEYWLPFWRAYRSSIQSVHQEAIAMVQPPVFEPPPHLTDDELWHRACSTQHFYDGLTLITKHWNWFNVDAVGILRGKYPGVIFGLKVGIKAVRRAMHDQIGYLRTDTLDTMGSYPTIMGELGTPYDLDKRRAYFGDEKGKGKGDYSNQVTALDTTLRGCEGTNILSYTSWTYEPSHSHLQGDQWNGEDFSLWSTDDIDFGSPRQAKYSSAVSNSSDTLTASESYNNDKSIPSSALTTVASDDAVEINRQAGECNHNHLIPDITFPSPVGDLHRGGRASRAFCRPYARATVGTPRLMTFDCDSGEFKLEVQLSRADAQVAAQTGKVTEIYVPMLHYARWAEGGEEHDFPELVISTAVPRSQDTSSHEPTLNSSSSKTLDGSTSSSQQSNDASLGLVHGVKGHYEDRPWIWGVQVQRSAGTCQVDTSTQLLQWTIEPTDPIFDSPLNKLALLRPGATKDHLCVRATLTMTRRAAGQLAPSPLQRTREMVLNVHGELVEKSPWSIDFWGSLADVAERALASVLWAVRAPFRSGSTRSRVHAHAHAHADAA